MNKQQGILMALREQHPAMGSKFLISIFMIVVSLVLSGCLSGGSGGSSSGSAGSGAPAVPPNPVTLSASRLGGVAPLSVFFSAIGTTGATAAVASSSPFDELEYRWSFGDLTSGNWQSTDGGPGRSKNSERGPMAVHVFELPGTYTVTLNVFDGSATGTQTTTITVSDPEVVFSGGATYCFATDGNFTGCPEANPANRITTADFNFAVNTYQGTGRRLLFKRGQSFTASAATPARISSNGPGIVGAFGGGVSKPVIDMQAGAVGLTISNTNSTINDWRIIDLEFNGNLISGNGISFAGGADQITMLRLNIHDIAVGIFNNPFFLNGQSIHIWDQLTVADSVVSNTVGQGAYLVGTQFAWIGNIIDGTPLSHNLRNEYLDKAVISHNIHKYPAITRHNIKLHAPCLDGPACVPITGLAGIFSQNILISDNKFHVLDGHGYGVAIAPQDELHNERIRNVIIERNWFESDGSVRAPLYLHASTVTVRNNIFGASSSVANSDYFPVLTDLRGASPGETASAVASSPQASGLNIYNNTAYTTLSAIIAFLNISNVGIANTVLRNNVMYAPNAVSAVLVRNQQGGVYTESNNSSNLQIKTVAPDWSNPAPAVPADFTLNAASYARNTGTPVKVFSDFSESSPRPVGQFDLGAFETN